MSSTPPRPSERVLPTLNRDGTRLRLRPRRIKGRLYRLRLLVAASLMALFVACPMLTLNGKPLILLDLPRREFTFFGATLLPTDSVLLMLLGLGAILSVFLATALFGRVWCGWGCPQTVYLEFLFRPLERLLEGKSYNKVRSSDRGYRWRLVLKHALFLLLSMVLGNLFLSYFVGLRTLLGWIQGSPLEHPSAFAVMAATAALVYFDFAYFREQTCIVACPYGRFQSALLDRHSWIVAYDARRGEPRGKRAKKGDAEAPARGDCIDCKLCTRVCPVGIDIRDGLQMECLTCTSCVDACNSVMARVGLPPGLVRYSSQDEQAGRARKLLRPRVVAYPAVLVLVLVLFGWNLGRKQAADITLLRGIGSPFTQLAGGQVSNQVRIKVVNRGGVDRRYRLTLQGLASARMIAPQNPLPVAAGKAVTTSVFVLAPRQAFAGKGEVTVTFHITDGHQLDQRRTYRLLGPRTAQ